MTHWVKPLRAAALAWVLSGALGGCTDDRPSLLGETCARTAHCEQPLRCVDAVCVTEVRARRLLATRRVSEPTSGDPNPAADLTPAADRIRPAVVPGIGVDELGRNAHPVADLAHAAFQYEMHALFATDLLDVDGATPVHHDRVARDDRQAGDA